MFSNPILRPLPPTPFNKVSVCITIAIVLSQTESKLIDSDLLKSIEEIKKYYSELCDIKRKIIDAKKDEYPDASYIISIIGKKNDIEISASFHTLDLFLKYLTDNRLIPEINTPTLRR